MGKRTSDFLALAAIACGGGLAFGLTGLVAGTASVARVEHDRVEYRNRTRTMEGPRQWLFQWRGLSNGVQEARVRAADLAREQADIEAEMDRVSEAGNGPGSPAGRALLDRKEVMLDEVAALEEHIDRLASEIQEGRNEASDRLREAATTISDDKLKERVRYSRGLIGVQDRDYTREFEAETTRVVEELAEELASASAAISESMMEFRPLRAEMDIRRDEEDQRRKRRRRRPRR